ncbi:DUF3667 domain-containing protein [Luteibacter sahnii]|jgi:hypothetical protein|uniref:DUF3667 domain-containing protein n=1 Tax=Luteibacter sahnii TaxID=3021977 RepID=UPI002A6B1D62|nr:DUF3667 domain-containing protein [Luteibacter sp. PPL193]MDY1549604.1 DUF3667 domain-containing protein [Luteibacter sp. PPL193]
MKELEPAPARYCANCGVALQGEFCHECGQSVHSVLRPMSHMLEDAGDIFFHMDERIVHTVPPLFTRPGFLTLEYFAGRRVRYIAPFRLMFVFCLLAFFFVHGVINDTAAGFHGIGNETGPFAKATTTAEVERLYATQAASLRKAAQEPNLPEAARAGFRTGEKAIRAQADARLAELKDPSASPGTPLVKADTEEDQAMLDGDWHVSIGWLPASMNARLDQSLARLKTNVNQVAAGGETGTEALHRIIEGVFGVLPQTMFVMVPVFALVLKLFYLLRRRLYMEHIIVALHSHAFLFLSLMVLVLLGLARGALAPHVPIAGKGIALVQWAVFLWMPAYLLLMQKRVYRQGWSMTILKYILIGLVYFWLLGFALTVAMFIGLAH